MLAIELSFVICVLVVVVYWYRRVSNVSSYVSVVNKDLNKKKKKESSFTWKWIHWSQVEGGKVAAPIISAATSKHLECRACQKQGNILFLKY